MSDAQDFTPNEAKVDVQENYYTAGVKNFADNEDIVSQTKQSVSDYDNRFISQRQEFTSEASGIWNLCDAFWRSGLNDTSAQTEKRWGANEPDKWERAKIGTTILHRQVTQKASNGYAVQTSKDMPFRYEALRDGDVVPAEQADYRARKLNLLAKWSMKSDKFNLKSIEFWTQVYKYGNIPVMVEWCQRVGRKVVVQPEFGEDGLTIVDYKTDEIETVTENRPVFTVLPIEAVKADATIGDIQSQECVIVQSIVGLSEIVDGIQTGLYRDDLLEDLGRSHQWDGSSGFENEDEKKDNRGYDNQPTTTGTGQYLKREVFVNLPIDEEKGTWDATENIPRRYRVTMFGNNPHHSVVARIERNQEPDDAIPVEMIHANPDDSDLLYHISPFEVIRPNIAAITTIERQILDNNTLVNKPPLWEVNGEVQGNSRQFGPDARWKVDSPQSIGFFNVRDLSQSNLGLLDYLKDDSNTANSIDKNMVGESFGARTSALEANTITGNSRRPNLVNIEYIMEQMLGFYAQRLKVNWETYGRADQVVQITDENGELVQIRPTDITGEYDIVIDIMDDIKDKAVEAQKMLNFVQSIANTPIAQTVDWKMLGEELSENMMGTSKFITTPLDGDAEAMARANIVKMLQNGQPLTGLTPNMNLRKHLEIYKDERMRWRGNEAQNPNIVLLDSAIEQLEAAINQQTAQAQGQQITTESQEQGNITGGVLGGVQ